MVDVIQRTQEYSKDHCWQYDIRLNNYKEDLMLCNLSEDEVKDLKTSDFEFKFVTDKAEQKRLAKFIQRHEWLGNLSQFTTHWFGAYYKGILAGVILMNMPNAFSKMLGENTKELERLVSRGACISWSPKNLASNFLMWCIKYMVKNTQYRLFTAYSDPTAKELGTIYQACNWYYLGQSSGGTKKYINPYTGKLVTDRVFRARSFYKRYAKDLGIQWQKDWSNDRKMLWENIPDDIEKQLRDYSKEVQKNSDYYIFPSKHKYAYVLGENKLETKRLRKEFLVKNKVYPYPKNRSEDEQIKRISKNSKVTYGIIKETLEEW
jgi:hypothetical protein